MISSRGLHGDWNMLKGKIKEQWGKLTDDDLAEIDGKREFLLGKIQKKYHLSRESAEKQIQEFENIW